MMQNSAQNFLDIVKRYSNPKIGFVFIFLIILQSVLLPLISANLTFPADYNKSADYSYFYSMSSYTMIVLGIIIFQAHGLEILSDHYSLWLIILTCFVRPNLRGNHELIYESYLTFLGFVLLIFVIANRRRFKMPNRNTIMVGFLWSVGTVLIIAAAQVLLALGKIADLPSNNIFYMLYYQISFVTVIEEVCFRGLIIGFMVMNGYKEDTAFFVQAILFLGIHYRYVATIPITFFISLPLLILSTTLLMKKYKIIFFPIMTHTFVNVFTYSLTFALQKYFS